MKVSLTEKADSKGTLVLFACEKEKSPCGLPKEARLIEEAKAVGFSGKINSPALLHPRSGKPARRVILIGLGKRTEMDLERLRRAAAMAAKKAKSLSQSAFSVYLPQVLGDAEKEARAVTEGILLAAYKFDKYKEKKKDETDLKEAFIVHPKASQTQAKSGLKFGHTLSEAACFARDLVNEPPSDMTPSKFAELAQEIAEKGKAAGVTITVYDKDQIEGMKMGALLGVNRGSAELPVFIHMHYKPEGAKKSVALVGKGITFDSGGLSLKPAQNMETMKMDMAGAASILGVFKAIPSVKPSVEIHGIMALTENMPGGRAQKPGDILRTMSGKSIEVLNTDAEGRLILADALTYAVKQKPDVIIDLATLTGACVVALGGLVAGAMGNSEDLFKAIEAASRESGEKFWPLPLVEDYKDGLKSPVADIKNISSIRGEGGSIIGGLFLQEFVEGKPWIHLDIAGPAWTDRELPYSMQGGTGFPTRTLVHYLLNQQ